MHEVRTYTVPEAAAILGLSPTSVYSAIRSGKFPVRAIRVGNRIIIPRKDLDALVHAPEERDEQPSPLVW